MKLAKDAFIMKEGTGDISQLKPVKKPARFTEEEKRYFKLLTERCKPHKIVGKILVSGPLVK